MARKRVTIKEAVSEPSVEVLDESTPKNTVDEVEEQVEVVSEPAMEVVNVGEEAGNEEVIEETVPKLKRRKRLSPEKMVDEAIKKKCDLILSHHPVFFDNIGCGITCR
mgnify:CR=1 FL=1